ncbi:hypothetical protein C479_03656 [Halovivax asiaticus JCM 14624]|uniref:Uncharacterized protein n=1 Tax=Halovivax asiaticus JCM 14624 TaxID=1227490 RepID=M0BSI6_9EURY|nr:hypothetical protein C479_03656 [Halovivax asiaticus JCM 14624]
MGLQRNDCASPGSSASYSALRSERQFSETSTTDLKSAPSGLGSDSILTATHQEVPPPEIVFRFRHQRRIRRCPIN